MSELPDGIEPAPIPLPKDSSLGIVLRRRGDGRFDVLLGRRARHSRFMPGNLDHSSRFQRGLSTIGFEIPRLPTAKITLDQWPPERAPPLRSTSSPDR